MTTPSGPAIPPPPKSDGSPPPVLNSRQRHRKDWIDRLLARGSWTLELVECPEAGDRPVASPHDPMWMYWHAPRVGPTGCLAVFLLHHASVTVSEVDLVRLAGAVGTPARYRLSANHALPNALHRAASAGLLSIDGDAGVIRLVAPVPRPGGGQAIPSVEASA